MNAQRLREKVARDISTRETPYAAVLEIMTDWGVFNAWTEEDFHTRPVNLDELIDCIAEEMEARR